MTRNEVTHERPSEYSIWHRVSLPDTCPATSISFLEVRNNNRVVAIIETGRMENFKFSDWQRKVILQIVSAIKVPYYFIEYYIDDSEVPNSYKYNRFNITNLLTQKQYKNVGNESYKEFLQNIDESKLKEISNEELKTMPVKEDENLGDFY